MALTIDVIKRGVTRSGKMVVADLDFDSSYPTGGEPLTPEDLGLSAIDFLIAEPAAGYLFEYDHTNEKLIARHFDYDAVADGAAIQVPNTTNLSAVTGVRVIAFGDNFAGLSQ